VRFPSFSAACGRETISKSCLVFFFFFLLVTVSFFSFFLEKSHSDNIVYSYDISVRMDFFSEFLIGFTAACLLESSSLGS
jgi:hypothetical protein